MLYAGLAMCTVILVTLVTELYTLCFHRAIHTVYKQCLLVYMCVT